MKLFNFLCWYYEDFKVVESLENSRVDSNLTTTTQVSVENQKELGSLPLLLVLEMQMAYLPDARKIKTTLIQVYYLFQEGAFSYLKTFFCSAVYF